MNYLVKPGRCPSGLLLALLLFFSPEAPAADVAPTINPGVPWPATDGLGRRLPLAGTVGLPRPGRFVGIFYFLTHDESPRWNRSGGPPDIHKILQQDPDALDRPDSPLWGQTDEPHYWSQPLYGYYRSTDPWVLRRHAQLLSEAGVDVLIFDTSNGRTYSEVYLKLCGVFEKIRRSGGRTPQIAFMVKANAGPTAEKIYRTLYRPGRYRELWFRWDGKPLMLCDPQEAGADIRRFFTLRAAHWPFGLTNAPDAWYWEAPWPQPYGYTDDSNRAEEVCVSPAQNLRLNGRITTNMSDQNARGRSFHDGREEDAPHAVDRGWNFAEQWQRVYALQPAFVFVTGWNEWTAQRTSRPRDPIVFVDEYNMEFSRDIEPMRGGFGDDYYYQMVAAIRRFKGVPPLPIASAPKSIHLPGSFRQWQDVRPEFRADFAGATPSRDDDGNGGLHYRDNSGRNDFELFKVARDATNLYFYARTRNSITPDTGANWMWLFIDADQNAATGWEGYDFVVNRTSAGQGTSWLEKNAGGWNWKKVARVSFRVKGRELMLAVPRTALGLADGSTRTRIDFKWADHLQCPGNVMDFYLSGDVAPAGRFNYRYDGK